MIILLWALGLGAALELVLQITSFGWRWRRGVAVVSLFLTAFASGGLVVLRPSLSTTLLVLVSLYRLFNMIRVVEGRMHEAYLRRSARRTTFALIGLQGGFGIVWWFWAHISPDAAIAWALLAALQLIGAALFLGSTLRRLARTAWPAKTKHYSDADLPTLSVAIPARNETEDLEICLQSLVASDYPKLEILVLDDCSQTKRTPEIIRAFAHDGVRFIQGTEPHDIWLPKNEAYKRLAEEASGDYILFCGADVRFAPHALCNVMELLLGRNKQMLSIVPERAAGFVSFSLAQGMRYYWELAPPRRLFRRPSVLDSCWVISRQALHKVGGFASAARSIVPAASFARRLAQSDEYSFMRAGKNPGIESAKSESDQRDTAIRTRYPQLHRRPENICLLTLAELTFFVLPFVLAIAGSWLDAGLLVQLIALVASVMLLVSYTLVSFSTRLHPRWFAYSALPFVALYDVALLHVSMWQYEFSIVEWRGRNICIPAMHVVPHLPKL